MKINGVTVTAKFHARHLEDFRAVEANARELRAELDFRAATDHPNPAYRADPAELANTQRRNARNGYDPQGYPQGWAGPREVDATWKPRTWAERNTQATTVPETPVQHARRSRTR